MSSFTSGFKELAQKLQNAKQTTPIAIDNALIDTSYEVIASAKDSSPIDTSTLEQSWEVNKNTLQLGENASGENHSLEVWASPDIIATNPKHPDGEYYPPMIENGFDLPNGKHFTGKHMLANAMTPAKNNLNSNLIKEIKDVFK